MAMAVSASNSMVGFPGAPGCRIGTLLLKLKGAMPEIIKIKESFLRKVNLRLSIV